MQETYLEAWNALDSLRDREKARAWLFGILRYRHAHLKRDSIRRIQPDRELGSVENLVADLKDDPLEDMAGRDRLQKALNALEDRYKEPFLMVFLEGLSCAETARQLELPLGTVLSRIHRARNALRKYLGWLDGIEYPLSDHEGVKGPMS